MLLWVKAHSKPSTQLCEGCVCASICFGHVSDPEVVIEAYDRNAQEAPSQSEDKSWHPIKLVHSCPKAIPSKGP